METVVSIYLQYYPDCADASFLPKKLEQLCKHICFLSRYYLDYCGDEYKYY